VYSQVLEAAAPDLSSEVKARVQDVLHAALPADKKATAVVDVLQRAGRAEPLTAAAQAAAQQQQHDEQQQQQDEQQQQQQDAQQQQQTGAETRNSKKKKKGKQQAGAGRGST
jgi:cobalamin biosynthesis protein CobT